MELGCQISQMRLFLVTLRQYEIGLLAVRHQDVTTEDEALCSVGWYDDQRHRGDHWRGGWHSQVKPDFDKDMRSSDSDVLWSSCQTDVGNCGSLDS